MMIKTSIITPVWNRNDLTAQYFYGHDIHYKYDSTLEWVIIDNGSIAETNQVLNYWAVFFGEKLVVIRNETNLGYAIACNQGARQARGSNLIFLNNDIIVKGDYITAIDRALKKEPRSLVRAQLIDGDTGWNVFNGHPLHYLVGWCLAMTRETYNDLGGFDERYSPAYYEDIDLCYHAQKEHYELKEVFLPLQHLGEQTGPQLEGRREITERNKAKFAQKWGLQYETK